MELQKEVLSFYSPKDNSDEMKRAMIATFYENIHRMQEQPQRFQMELHQHVSITIDYVTVKEDASLLEKQILPLQNYIAKCPAKDVSIKQNLLYQLALFQSVYVIRLTYPKSLRSETILALMEVADQLSALIFWESQDLTDSYGDILLNRNGDSEVAFFVPIETVNWNDRHYSYTDEQKQRILHSQTILQNQGIYVPSNLPVMEEDSTYVFQEKEDILKRVIASYCIGLYCDFLQKFRGDERMAYENCEESMMTLHAFPYFTVSEIDFLSKHHPSEQESEAYYYYHENCLTFLWSVGLVAQLPFPDHRFTYQEGYDVIAKLPALEKLMEAAQIRSKKSLLDMIDLTQRYLWAYQDAEKNGFQPPYDMDENRCKERLRCLYWIIDRSSHTWEECEEEVEKTIKLLKTQKQVR